MKNYKEIMEDIIDISKRHTVVSGSLDLHITTASSFGISMVEMTPTNIDFWCHLGNASDEEITKSIQYYLKESRPNRSDLIEGCYTFDAILSYIEAEYELLWSRRNSIEGSYQISREYWVVEHIDLKFQETFIQRERQKRITELLFDDTLPF